MASKIKKGDKVVVLAGKHRGQEAEVVAVMPKDDRVLVKGVNIVAKHQRQSATSRGGPSSWSGSGAWATKPPSARARPSSGGSRAA